MIFPGGEVLMYNLLEKNEEDEEITCINLLMELFVRRKRASNYLLHCYPVSLNLMYTCTD